MSQTLVVLHLWVQGLEEGDEHPPTLSSGTSPLYMQGRAPGTRRVLEKSLKITAAHFCTGWMTFMTHQY